MQLLGGVTNREKEIRIKKGTREKKESSKRLQLEISRMEKRKE